MAIVPSTHARGAARLYLSAQSNERARIHNCASETLAIGVQEGQLGEPGGKRGVGGFMTPLLVLPLSRTILNKRLRTSGLLSAPPRQLLHFEERLGEIRLG